MTDDLYTPPCHPVPWRVIRKPREEIDPKTGQVLRRIRRAWTIVIAQTGYQAHVLANLGALSEVICEQVRRPMFNVTPWPPENREWVNDTISRGPVEVLYYRHPFTGRPIKRTTRLLWDTQRRRLRHWRKETQMMIAKPLHQDG